MTRGQNALGS